MMNRSRRKFLKTSAGAAGLCLVGPTALVKAMSAKNPCILRADSKRFRYPGSG